MKPKIKYETTKVVKSVSFDATLSRVGSDQPSTQGFYVEVCGTSADREFLEQIRTMMHGTGNVRVKLTVLP